MTSSTGLCFLFGPLRSYVAHPVDREVQNTYRGSNLDGVDLVISFICPVVISTTYTICVRTWMDNIRDCFLGTIYCNPNMPRSNTLRVVHNTTCITEYVASN